MKTAKKIPALILERALLNELPEKKMKEVMEILSQDPEEKNRFEALKASNDEFFKKYPVFEMSQKITEKQKGESKIIPFEPTRKKSKIWVMIPSLAAAAVIFMLFFPFHQVETDQGKLVYDDETRLKGLAPRISIYQKKGNGISVLKQNDALKKSDLVQIAYLPAGFHYGVIFSLDGFGSVTLHFPENEKASNLLVNTGREILLDNAYELDNAPEFERFFFVASKEPIDTAWIMKQAGQLAKNKEKRKEEGLKLKDNMEQFSILLKKGALQ